MAYSSTITKTGVFIIKSQNLFSRDEKYSLTLGHDSFQLYYKSYKKRYGQLYKSVHFNDVLDISLVVGKEICFSLRRQEFLWTKPLEKSKLHDWYAEFRSAWMRHKSKEFHQPKKRGKSLKQKQKDLSALTSKLIRSNTTLADDIQSQGPNIALLKLKQKRMSRSFNDLTSLENPDVKRVSHETQSNHSGSSSGKTSAKARIPVNTTLAKDLYLQHESKMVENSEIIINQDFELYRHQYQEELEDEAQIPNINEEEFTERAVQFHPSSFKEETISVSESISSTTTIDSVTSATTGSKPKKFTALLKRMKAVNVKSISIQAKQYLSFIKNRDIYSTYIKE